MRSWLYIYDSLDTVFKYWYCMILFTSIYMTTYTYIYIIIYLYYTDTDFACLPLTHQPWIVEIVEENEQWQFALVTVIRHSLLNFLPYCWQPGMKGIQGICWFFMFYNLLPKYTVQNLPEKDNTSMAAKFYCTKKLLDVADCLGRCQVMANNCCSSKMFVNYEFIGSTNYFGSSPPVTHLAPGSHCAFNP